MAAIERALVTGAGIGGLTTAIALCQQGVSVDLVEIAPSLAVYGVGIIQPNNILRAFDRIGLAQACVDAGAPFPGWQIFDKDGHLLMAAPGSTDAAPGFPANNGITRPVLHRILSERALAKGVDLRLNASVADLSEADDLVSVTFADGSRAAYDLVIACEGINSAMRTRLFGESAAPKFVGQGVWRYNLPRPKDMAWGGVYFGNASKVGLVPLSPDLMYMFVVTAEPDNAWYDESLLADVLRERIGEYRGLIADLAPLITDSSAVVYRPMFNVMLPQPWHKGRVVVIGDAAHATTPHLAQGAAMAVEDGVLLAELMGRDGRVSDHLEEFTRRRFDRAKFVVDTSTQLAAWELEAWAGIQNPDADPGGLLHRSTHALMEAY